MKMLLLEGVLRFLFGYYSVRVSFWTLKAWMIRSIRRRRRMECRELQSFLLAIIADGYIHPSTVKCLTRYECAVTLLYSWRWYQKYDYRNISIVAERFPWVDERPYAGPGSQ